jgi:hypothetical protein
MTQLNAMQADLEIVGVLLQPKEEKEAAILKVRFIVKFHYHQKSDQNNFFHFVN